MSKDDMVIISAVRTPFGRFGGFFKDVDIYDLGAQAMKASLERISLSGDRIDEVWWGIGDTTSTKDPYTPVVARQSLLKAGLPPETPSCTLDKACVSGMSAINYGIRSIKAAEVEVVMAGGATSFSTVPYLARNLRFSGVRVGGFKLEDPIFPLGYKDYAPVAVDSGDVAVEYGVSREEQDEWAVMSHLKYGEAYNAGRFQDEIAPYVLKGNDGSIETLALDEQYRPGIRYEDLAKMSTIFGSKTCTAGNAPGMNDGACAVIVTTRGKAGELGLQPLGTVLGMVTTAARPRLLPVAPALAIHKLFKKLDVTIDDMDLFEINEAFACVPLVSAKILAGNDPVKYQAIKDRMNVNGGAISIGHPNTCSGARLVATLIYELRRRGGGLGVAAICGGLTQGDAAVIKVD